jgi:hypothetical protein
MSQRAHSLTPVTVAVVVSLFVAACVIAIAAAIGGSYLLTLRAIHDAQAGQKAAGVQTCKALHVLDSAHDGISFPLVNKAHPSEEALTKMFAGIHDVYESSGCSELLSGHTP